MTAQALRMPFATVPNAADLLGDAHLAEREFFEQQATPAGELRLPGAPFRMSETPLHGIRRRNEARRTPTCSSANSDTRRTT